MKNKRSRVIAVFCAFLVAVPLLGIAIAPGEASAQQGETYFVLYGEAGDPVTQGEDLLLAESADVTFSTDFNDWGGVSITVDASSGGAGGVWQVDFAPEDFYPFSGGEQLVAIQYPFNNGTAGLSVVPDQETCRDIVGEFTIREVTYRPSPDNGIESFAADFRQSCDNGRPMVGGIRINSTLDNPDPNYTIQPAPTGETSFTVYSGPGDFLSQDQDHSVVPSDNAHFTARVGLDNNIGLSQRDNEITVVVDTIENGYVTPLWSASFSAPNDVPLAAGDEFEGAIRHIYFPGDGFPPLDSPGLHVTGPNGRGCGTQTGEFRIYELTVNSIGQVEKFAADFSQLCGSRDVPTIGGVRINSTVPVTNRDFTPVGEAPPPTGDESYLVVYGEPGEYITQGNDIVRTESTDIDFWTFLNRQSGISARIDVNNNGVRAEQWQVDFAAPDGAPLQAGDSFLATRFPLQEPGQAGISIGGAGRVCDQIAGEFAIQEVVYGQGTNEIESFAADFRLSCDNGRPIVGGIRVNTDLAATARDFSISPAPTGATSFTLFGNPDDFLSQGSDVSLTPSADVTYVAQVGLDNLEALSITNNEITVRFDIAVNGQFVEGSSWSASFSAPNDRLLVAGDEFSDAIKHLWVPGDPWPDSERAGLYVSGINGRGCVFLDGEFRIYELSVNAIGQVEKFAADFRQFCGTNPVPSVGGVRINSDVPVTDPGFLVEPPVLAQAAPREEPPVEEPPAEEPPVDEEPPAEQPPVEEQPPVDDTAPVAQVELIQKGRIRGTASNFDVAASCSDENPGSEMTSLEINGVAVSPDQRVRLIVGSRERVRTNSKGKLIIKSASITLAVTCVDAAGNTSTASVQPSYEG